MINLTQYARLIETGLNDLLNEENIKFNVWSDLGKYKKAIRRYNAVTTYINCVLSRAPGTIETGNDGLIIASDSITMTVAVPKIEPKQTVDEPSSETDDGVYTFVERIRNVMDAYFSTNIVRSITENGLTYETGMQYSISSTGDLNLFSMTDEIITFSVYITINVVQNGINSRSVHIELDGEPIPFLSASPNRAGEKSTDVYSDSGESETIITSTVFAVDVAQPMTTGRVTSQFNDYLLGGQKNVMHFMKLTVGDQSVFYKVTFGDISASVEGSLNVGTSIPFIKVRDNFDVLSYPPYFTVGRLTPSGNDMVSITPTKDCILDFCGIREVKAGETVSGYITEDMAEYDEDAEAYFVAVRTCPSAELSVSGATLIVDQR